MTTLDPWPAVDDTPPLYTVAEPRLMRGDTLQVPARDHVWLVRAAEEVRLLGRGGAAFPVARKLAAVGAGAAVLANGSESEPASWKDRALMRHFPDLVVAGVAMVGEALRSPRALIAVGDAAAASAMSAAVRRSGARLEMRHVSHRFVGGEIEALIKGLDGGAPVPNGIKVLPHTRGLSGLPTYASNVETFAQLALLAALGPASYAAVGSRDEPGTSLLTVHGAARDGVMEVPHGQDLRQLLDRADRPVLLGGYHGRWTTRTALVLDRRWLGEHGLAWGAGVVAVLPDETCPVGEIARVAWWLATQSAGQCGPCVFGLPALAEDLAELADGRRVDLALLRRRALQVSGRGACHHPTGVAGFVSSALDAFDADARRHAGGGHCGRPTLGTLPIGSGR